MSRKDSDILDMSFDIVPLTMEGYVPVSVPDSESHFNPIPKPESASKRFKASKKLDSPYHQRVNDRFRFYPSKEQAVLLQKLFGCVRSAYNFAKEINTLFLYSFEESV